MNAEERRENIQALLREKTEPVSATALAKIFSVSRQVIVGDVALLRASGAEITAVSRGYVLQKGSQEGLLRKIACLHTGEDMEKELNICVDFGCCVVDVIVEHPVYGQLTGELQLKSRYDVQQFVARAREEKARALSELTDGVHLHTLLCPSEEIFQKTCAALHEANLLYEM